VRFYQRDPQTMRATPELQKEHQRGKSQVITDGEVTLAESGAILEYLVERYGNGRFIPPAGTPERLRHTYWMHYAEGSLMPPLLLKLVFDQVGKAKMPLLARPVAKGIVNKVRGSFVQPQIDRHLDYLEGELKGRDWFAGPDFTSADVQMSFPLEAAQARAGLDGKRPNLLAFLSRIHARPAYERALAKGGPYDIVG
jgi:glutathione S-transferase